MVINAQFGITLFPADYYLHPCIRGESSKIFPTLILTLPGFDYISYHLTSDMLKRERLERILSSNDWTSVLGLELFCNKVSQAQPGHKSELWWPTATTSSNSVTSWERRKPAVRRKGEGMIALLGPGTVFLSDLAQTNTSTKVQVPFHLEINERVNYCSNKNSE